MKYECYPYAKEVNYEYEYEYDILNRYIDDFE